MWHNLIDRFRADDHGSSALSVVIGMLGFMLIFATLLQTALFFHARDVGNTCAEKAMRNTRSQLGNPALGTAAGYACIAQAGTGDLQFPAVLVTKGARESTVDIVGKAPSLVPFFTWTVRVQQVKPNERVTNPGELG